MLGLSEPLGGGRQDATGREEAPTVIGSAERPPEPAGRVTFAEEGTDRALQLVPRPADSGSVLGGEPGGALVPVGGSELAVQFSEWSLSFKRENRAWQQEQERLRAEDKRAWEKQRNLDLEQQQQPEAQGSQERSPPGEPAEEICAEDL